jgi:hypothetical protein
MNRIEKYLADRKLEKEIKNLDLSNGFPLNNDQILEPYLSNLFRVDQGIQEIAGQPREVFYGEAKSFLHAHAFIKDIRQDLPRQSPPRIPKQAELGTVLTTQVEPTLVHITQIASKSLNVDPKNQAVLIGKTIESLKENRGRYSSVKINPDWELRLVVDYSAGDDSWITSFMVPVEKDGYSNQLIAKNSKRLKKQIRPENLKETVDEAAKTNFCVTERTVAELDPFNLGGDKNLSTLITESGYSVVTDHDTWEYLFSRRIDKGSVFRHEDLRSDSNSPLLRKEQLFGYNNTVRLSAVVPPALTEEIRLKFKNKFQKAAEKEIKSRIKEGLKSNQDINLNPDDIAVSALGLLEHHLPSGDYEEQIDWLCSITLGQTLETMAGYPKTKDAANLLSQTRKLAATAQRLDDHLNVISDSGDAEFTLGWSPDNVTLVFPATMFAKK